MKSVRIAPKRLMERVHAGMRAHPHIAPHGNRNRAVPQTHESNPPNYTMKPTAESNSNQTQEIDVYQALEIVDSYARTAPSQDQIKVLEDCCSPYKDVIDAAVAAAKRFRESPEGAAKLAALEDYLKGKDPSIDGEALALELVNDPEFAPVIEAAADAGGKSLKAIGLGLSYHYSFLTKGGREQGIEGIIIFPQTVGNSTVPTQTASRKWDYNTRQFKVDLGVTVGLNLSLWWAIPFTSSKLAGLMGEIALLLGLSAGVTGGLPTGTSANKEAGQLPLPSVINTLSVGLDLGLAFGAAIITGEQEVSITSSLATVAVINTATNIAVMKAGLPANLKVTLFYPFQGKAPTVILQTGTTLSMGMPAFLSDSLATAAVVPPSGWEYKGASQGAFAFAYKGPNNQAWNTNLVFMIENVVSNAGVSGDMKGLVKATMDGITSTRGPNTSVPATPAALELTPLVFTATISWKVVIGTNTSFKIKQGPSSGNGEATTPPSSFQTLPPESGTPTIVTDPQGIDWLVGYKFLIQDNQPFMQAAWQQDGSPPTPKFFYASGLYQLSGSPTTISIYYKNVNSATNPELTITATLQSD